MSKISHVACRKASAACCRHDLETAFCCLSACLQSWRLNVLSESQRKDIRTAFGILIGVQDSLDADWLNILYPDRHD